MVSPEVDPAVVVVTADDSVRLKKLIALTLSRSRTGLLLGTCISLLSTALLVKSSLLMAQGPVYLEFSAYDATALVPGQRASLPLLARRWDRVVLPSVPIKKAKEQQRYADFRCEVDPYVARVRAEADDDKAPADNLLWTAGCLILLVRLFHCWSDWSRLRAVMGGADDHDLTSGEKKKRNRAMGAALLAAALMVVVALSYTVHSLTLSAYYVTKGSKAQTFYCHASPPPTRLLAIFYSYAYLVLALYFMHAVNGHACGRDERLQTVRVHATMSDLVQGRLVLSEEHAELSEYVLRRMAIAVRDESKTTQTRLGFVPQSKAVDAAWRDAAHGGGCSATIKDILDATRRDIIQQRNTAKASPKAKKN